MFHIRHVDGYYQDLTFCICFGKVDMSQSAGYGIGGCVSEMDFRPEGFGIVRIHGPFIFKWEMCVSEEGHRPVEGIMSVFDLPVYDSHLLQTNLEMHPHVRKMIDPLLGIHDGRYKAEILGPGSEHGSVVESWPRPRSPSSQDEGFMRRKKAKRGVYD